MRQEFQGWPSVAAKLRAYAEDTREETAARLNEGQHASLCGLAERLANNGAIVADEVGMGKTRIAVEVIRSVKEAGGRVAVLLPPGLGYQWQTELSNGGVDAPPILRSLRSYFRAWDADNERNKAWFEEPKVDSSNLSPATNLKR